MSILDALPHRAAITKRVKEKDVYGGGRRRDDAVSSGIPCWQQTASDRDVTEYAKRGITVTDKVYFTGNVDVDESNGMTITNSLAGSTVSFDVVSKAVPDASAGMGVVWRVMLNARTDEGEEI